MLLIETFRLIETILHVAGCNFFTTAKVMQWSTHTGRQQQQDRRKLIIVLQDSIHTILFSGYKDSVHIICNYVYIQVGYY